MPRLFSNIVYLSFPHNIFKIVIEFQFVRNSLYITHSHTALRPSVIINHRIPVLFLSSVNQHHHTSGCENSPDMLQLHFRIYPENCGA